MGLRAGVVVCVTSFLLGKKLLFISIHPPPTHPHQSGALFTHWIADSLTLWKSPITDEHLWTAASYYSILTKGPVQILYFLSAVVVLGGTTIIWSLRDGQAGNIMFDGGSIFLFGTTIIMYLYSVLPNLFASFSTLPTHQLKDPFPGALRHVTLELASNNLICSVALTGVLALQAGRFWAESSDEDDFEAIVSEDLKAQRSHANAPEVQS
ncbi:hypothetical protein AX17_003423 [Amanita inopinata Kibby_2008]|nr:hypothetical protein AX17_003423 [Amanita inopinata Kibby_2008]